ncbi:hypothetical protein [Modestobacter marinus]|nr:hypothetical protein [Modestobacter marinus]
MPDFARVFDQLCEELLARLSPDFLDDVALVAVHVDRPGTPLP